MKKITIKIEDKTKIKFEKVIGRLSKQLVLEKCIEQMIREGRVRTGHMANARPRAAEFG